MKKLICLSLALLCGCAPARKEAAQRTFLPGNSKLNDKVTATLVDPLDDPDSNATSRVAALAQNTSAQNRFMFLGDLQKDRNGQMQGRIDIAANPFVRLSIATAVKRDDIDTFIAQAHKAHDNGELTTAQWLAFLAAEGIYNATKNKTLLVTMQTKAINGKVAAAFPGVLGGTNSVDKSLPMLWARKFDSAINLENPQVQKTFGASVPLFAGDDLASDMKLSLSAAISSYPFDRNISDSDRMASLVLFQRMWSQLLTLKGYEGVGYATQNGRAAIPALTDAQNAYPTSVHPGYFFDAQTGKNLNLSPQDIGSYNPASRLILLSDGAGHRASLANEILTARGLGLAFEATSPAAYFVTKPQNYLLGDVTSAANKAVIPEEAHSLAFGLFAMELQNIAATRLAQVNAKGQDVTVAGGDVSGLVIFDEQNGQKTVDLENILQMIRLYVQMNSTINDIMAKAGSSPAELASMNSFYKDGSALANLTKLQAALVQMRVGLYLLTMDFVNANSESAAWDPRNGMKFSATKLSSDRKKDIGLVLRDLAIDMDQPLIFADANKLLGERD